jgi:CBS domain-containing protein
MQTARHSLASPVQTYLSGVVACVAEDATLREVARKLTAIEAGALVVGSTASVTGVVSERDIVEAAGLGDDLDTRTAVEVARTDLVWCPPATPMAEVAALMTAQRVRHVLIGERGRLVGIVSARDVVAAGQATAAG